MKCKVCGANNEDFLEYCENCAAHLTGSEEPADDINTASREPRSWGFVSSPDWSKPDFSANNVSEEDIPEDFQSQSLRPRYNSVQQTASEASAKRNSVRTSVKAATEAHCPHCNAAVQADQNFCNECGKRMDEPDYPRYRQSSVSTTAATAPAGSAPGIKYAEPIDDEMFSFNYDDEEDERPRKKKSVQKTASSKPASRSQGSRSRKRSGLAVDRSLIFWIIAAVLVVALVVLGIVLVKNSGGLSSVFGDIFSSSPVTKDPTVEKTTTESGDPAYNITVHAKKGSIVHFEGGSIKHDTEVTQSQPVTLSVPEAVWIPSEPVEGDKLNIYPNITVIAKDGTETPLAFAEPIVIDIPTLNMTVIDPASPTFETATPHLSISGVVEDPTSTVYVNDMQLPVDESGNFSGTYSLSTEGESTVNVEARKNGYAIARNSFTVTYNAASSTAPAGTTPGTTGGGTATPGTLPTGATDVAYSTTADLNVRSQPNTSSSDTVLGKLALNQKIYVIEKDAGNSWAKILYNGSEAYVSNLLINVVSDYTVKEATVNADQLNGRATSSSSAESVTKFPINTKVSYIKDVGNGWSMIEYNDRIVYAATNYLTIS